MCHAILLISCPDQRGITASVTEFIYMNNGNIVHADQHIDEQNDTFFMRIEWSLEGLNINRDKIEEAFRPIANKFQMVWELSFTDQRPRVAIFVSRHLHCLVDLLYRHKAGQLACDFPLIISNHDTLKPIARQFDIDFYHFPIDKENKAEQEKQEIELLKKHNIDFVVLARYMQILSKDFISHFPNKVINIHHSFLPAFAGAKPYHAAHERGVKIIGATSHYVTEQLDEGPIIEQSTVRISHRDSLEDLVRKGEDLEKVVLNRALRLALQKKILSYNNKTIVFD